MRNRIVKSMMLTTLITILLLSTMLSGLFMLSVQGIGTMLSTMSGNEIVRFISSPMIRNSLGMEDIEEILTTEKGRVNVVRQIEYRNRIHLTELLDEEKMLERTHFNKEDAQLIEIDDSGELIHEEDSIQMLGLALYVNDELIYENDGNLTEKDLFLSKVLDTYSEIDIINPRTGNVFGVLEVQIHKDVLNTIVLIVLMIFLVLCILTLIIALFISKLITIPITRPLRKLHER